MAKHDAMQDVVNYDCKLAAIESHLEAARSLATGIFLTNPDSRKLPSHDLLCDAISGIYTDIHQSRILAAERLIEITNT